MILTTMDFKAEVFLTLGFIDCLVAVDLAPTLIKEYVRSIFNFRWFVPPGGSTSSHSASCSPPKNEMGGVRQMAFLVIPKARNSDDVIKIP